MAGVKPKILVKPGTPWNSERRLELLGGLCDDLGGRTPRFERCTEVQRDRSTKKFLLKRVNLREEAPDRRRKELNMLTQLQHDNILRYKDAWESHDVQYILCEDARMFLSTCLRKMAPNRPSSSLFPLWLYQLSSALEYMHQRNNEDQPMLHRNVHPDNILVNNRCILKLCAFDVSKRLETPQRRAGWDGTAFGGGLFQSPEQRARKHYDYKADIWSLGKTAVYIADYTQARKAASESRLLEILQQSGQDQLLNRVVRDTLQEDPDRRPRASDIAQVLKDNYGRESSDWGCSPPARHDFPSPLVDSSKGKSPAEPTTTSVKKTPSSPERHRQVPAHQAHTADTASCSQKTPVDNDPSSPVRDRDKPSVESGHPGKSDHEQHKRRVRSPSHRSLTTPTNESQNSEKEKTEEPGSEQAALGKTVNTETQTSFFSKPPTPKQSEVSTQTTYNQPPERNQPPVRLPTRFVILKARTNAQGGLDIVDAPQTDQAVRVITRSIHPSRTTPVSSPPIAPHHPTGAVTSPVVNRHHSGGSSDTSSFSTPAHSWPDGSSAERSDSPDGHRREWLELLSQHTTPPSTPSTISPPSSTSAHHVDEPDDSLSTSCTHHRRYSDRSGRTPKPASTRTRSYSSSTCESSRSTETDCSELGSQDRTRITRPCSRTSPGHGLADLQNPLTPDALRYIGQTINNRPQKQHGGQPSGRRRPTPDMQGQTARGQGQGTTGNGQGQQGQGRQHSAAPHSQSGVTAPSRGLSAHRAQREAAAAAEEREEEEREEVSNGSRGRRRSRHERRPSVQRQPRRVVETDDTSGLGDSVPDLTD